MSLGKITHEDYCLEKEMGRKLRSDYNPILQTLHPNSNENRVDHMSDFFTSKLRDPLPHTDKFVPDRTILNKAHYAQKEKRMQEDARLVASLPTYDEPSDDLASRPTNNKHK